MVSLAFALVQKSVKDVGMDFLRTKWENLQSWLSRLYCATHTVVVVSTYIILDLTSLCGWLYLIFFTSTKSQNMPDVQHIVFLFAGEKGKVPYSL